MIPAPKAILIVARDDVLLTALSEGLTPYLSNVHLHTAWNVRAALGILEHESLDVVIAELDLPEADGFELLASMRRLHPNVPVVVISSRTEAEVRRGAPELGVFRLLSPSADPALVARNVLEARIETARGKLIAVSLAPLLELLGLERRTCGLLVESAGRKGRLHFRDGALVNAYAFESGADGAPAAREILSWEHVDVDFERSLHNHERKIETPLATLLLEAAVMRDRASSAASLPHQAEALPGHERGTALTDAMAGLERRLATTRSALSAITPIVLDAGSLLDEALSDTRRAREEGERYLTMRADVERLARQLAETAERFALVARGDDDLPPAPA
jgi:DNA-binding response OmpR family regulator